MVLAECGKIEAMKPALIALLLCQSLYASSGKTVMMAAGISTLTVNVLEIKTTVRKWKRAVRIAGHGMKRIVGK